MKIDKQYIRDVICHYSYLPVLVMDDGIAYSGSVTWVDPTKINSEKPCFGVCYVKNNELIEVTDNDADVSIDIRYNSINSVINVLNDGLPDVILPEGKPKSIEQSVRSYIDNADVLSMSIISYIHFDEFIERHKLSKDFADRFRDAQPTYYGFSKADSFGLYVNLVSKDFYSKYYVEKYAECVLPIAIILSENGYDELALNVNPVYGNGRQGLPVKRNLGSVLSEISMHYEIDKDAEISNRTPLIFGTQKEAEKFLRYKNSLKGRKNEEIYKINKSIEEYEKRIKDCKYVIDVISNSKTEQDFSRAKQLL